MKRPLALTAYLLATVSLALYVVLYLVGTIRLLSWAGGFGATTIVVFLVAAIYGVALALNAASISSFTASPEKYKKKKATAIAAIVFNFITVLLLFISLVAMNTSLGAFLAFPLFALIPNNGFIAILVIVLLCVLAATVLAIVDLALEKKRVYSNPKSAQAEVAEATVEAQLAKITAMKENGTINDEEYQKLRQSIIEKASK